MGHGPPCGGRVRTAAAPEPTRHAPGAAPPPAHRRLNGNHRGCAYKNSLAGAGGPGWGLGGRAGGCTGHGSRTGPRGVGTPSCLHLPSHLPWAVLLPDASPSPRRADVDGVGRVGFLFPQLRQHRDSCPPAELPERPEAAVRRTPLRGAAVSPHALPRYLPWGRGDADPCPPPTPAWPRWCQWPRALSAVPSRSLPRAHPAGRCRLRCWCSAARCPCLPGGTPAGAAGTQ